MSLPSIVKPVTVLPLMIDLPDLESMTPGMMAGPWHTAPTTPTRRCVLVT